jgi:hypothetical protein
VESSCELSNEPSGSIKCWETTEWLGNLWPLEWYSAPQISLVTNKQQNQLHGFDSASGLYRLSHHHWSANFSVAWSALRTPQGCQISVFWTGTITFYFKCLRIYAHEAEWSPLQSLCYSENLVAPGIEPGPLDLQLGTLTTRSHRRA